MTTRTKRTAKPRQIEALISSDRVLLKELMKEALQEVLEAEMTEALGAGPGERTADRVGYRSGYYSRGLVTRIGKLELRVPRDREGRFSTELFERYQRSEKARVSALAEMYVQGVSTRKVTAITEELCGHTFSASTVSRINKSLEALLQRFAQRRLDEVYPSVIFDARYEKVRLDGVIQSQAVFIALGINEEGRRQVLGVELSNRESQSWTTFVKGLKTRGLHGVEFVVSDDHAGIKRAVRELLPRDPVPGGVHRARDQRGGPAPGAGGGALQPRVTVKLDDVRERPEDAGAARGGVRRVRRPRGDQAGRARAAPGGGLAALRCRHVHFLRNALDYLPRKADDDCRQELRWFYDRRNLKEAQQDLQAWLTRWEHRYPKLTDWVEANIGETLNFYSLPRQHHNRRTLLST